MNTGIWQISHDFCFANFSWDDKIENWEIESDGNIISIFTIKIVRLLSNCRRDLFST